MDGIFPFQRRDQASSVRVVATVGLSTLVTLQVSGIAIVEIANISLTDAATFCFTGTNQTLIQATTTMRTIPAQTVLYERVPQGLSFASAAALSGTPTLVFTPGVNNG